MLMSTLAFANDGHYIKLGVGVDDDVSSVKFGAIGYQAPLISLFDYQLEGGAFTNKNELSHLTEFVGASIGVSVSTQSGLYSKFFSGPALLSHKDSRLSSVFEFNNDVEFGLSDAKGTSIGVCFKHMSNAGLVFPNYGRDFGLVKLQFTF